MSLKPQIEAIIYAAEEPVTLAQLLTLLGPDLEQVLAEMDSAQQELPVAETTGGEAEDAVENVEIVAELDPKEAENNVQNDENEPLLADEKKLAQQHERRLRDLLKSEITSLMADYEDRGVFITEVASGYRMSTKPEYHDLIRDFAKSLKPPLKLSLPALETLAVIAYKQPVTAAEVGDIRGVDSGGVLGGLMTRKLITTAGRKQVIGRPILYKTTKEFLLRFGLKDVAELPSIEEFEKMAGELAEQEDLPMGTVGNPDIEPNTPEPLPQADGTPEPTFEEGNPAPDVVGGTDPETDGGKADDVRDKPEGGEIELPEGVENPPA